MKTKNGTRPPICLRVYLKDAAQEKLVVDAARKAQKTKKPNVSQFVREAALARAAEINAA